MVPIIDQLPSSKFHYSTLDPLILAPWSWPRNHLSMKESEMVPIFDIISIRILALKLRILFVQLLPIFTLIIETLHLLFFVSSFMTASSRFLFLFCCFSCILLLNHKDCLALAIQDHEFGLFLCVLHPIVNGSWLVMNFDPYTSLFLVGFLC